MNLTPDALTEVLLRTKFDDLLNMASVSKTNYEIIYNNNWFWYLKYEYDYGNEEGYAYDPDADWFSVYFNYRNVYVFGNNKHGSLGIEKDGVTCNATLMPNIRARKIECSDDDTIILDLEGNLWVMGLNYYGKFGVGEKLMIKTPMLVPNIKAKQLSSKYNHTMFIDFDGNLYAMGLDNKHQLGLNIEYNQYDNYTVSIPEKVKNIPKAKYVSCGENHSVVIDIDNNVWCVGSNEKGQLGMGNVAFVKNFKLLPNLKAKFVECGPSHTFLIDVDDNLWCMGHNENGQLGTGDTLKRTTPFRIPDIKPIFISSSSTATFVIDKNYDLHTCGLSIHGNLGLGKDMIYVLSFELLPIKAKSVSASINHTAIVDFDGNLFVMGNNFYSELGLHTHGFSVYDPTLVSDLPPVIDVSCGVDRTMIIAEWDEDSI